MKIRKSAKSFAAAGSVMLAAVLFCGCSNGQPPASAKTESSGSVTAEATTGSSGGASTGKSIGFVGMTLNNEYHITLANGARKEAEAQGVQIEIQAGDQHASADAQLGIIENMIANHVDGILLVPSSSDGLESALLKCKEAGIPIINLDTKLTDKSLENVGMSIPFYGTNNYEGAKLAGEYVAEHFPKGVKVAILKGIEGQTNAKDRYDGFLEGAGDAVVVLAEQTANWEVDQGYTAAQNIISANPDIQLFFCCNDNMGIGALRAIKEANLQDQIQIIGFDAVSEALNLVESGAFAATVAQYPAEMGKLGVQNMVKIFQGQSAEMSLDTGTKVITKENVEAFKDYLKSFE